MDGKQMKPLPFLRSESANVAEVCGRYNGSSPQKTPLRSRPVRSTLAQAIPQLGKDAWTTSPERQHFPSTNERATSLRTYLDSHKISEWIEKDLEALKELAFLPAVPSEALSLIRSAENSEENVSEEKIEDLHKMTMDLQQQNADLLRERQELLAKVEELRKQLSATSGPEQETKDPA